MSALSSLAQVANTQPTSADAEPLIPELPEDGDPGEMEEAGTVVTPLPHPQPLPGSAWHQQLPDDQSVVHGTWPNRNAEKKPETPAPEEESAQELLGCICPPPKKGWRVQAEDPVLPTASRKPTPPEILNRMVRTQDETFGIVKWQFPAGVSNAGATAFHEYSDKLQFTVPKNAATESEKKANPVALEVGLTVAIEKGWVPPHLDGTDAFKEQAFIVACKMGIPVTGYTPTPEMISTLKSQGIEIPGGDSAELEFRPSTQLLEILSAPERKEVPVAPKAPHSSRSRDMGI